MDLDRLRAGAPGLELDEIVEATDRAVTVRARSRGRPVLVRFLVDPHRDPKRLVKLAQSLAERGPICEPGLVPVLEANAEADPPYVVEAPVAGEPLSAALARGRRVEPGRLARELAAGLAALAERGLVHGEVAPGAVWVGADGARLGRLAEAQLPLDENDPARGEQEAYLAPEAIAGRPSGAPGDVYAMALVVCEAAAGRALFANGVPLRVGPPMRLAGWAPGPDLAARMGPWLTAIAGSCLDLKPGQRPQASWLAAQPTGHGPTPGRTALALAPIALFFALVVSLLVTGAMRDLGQQCTLITPVPHARHTAVASAVPRTPAPLRTERPRVASTPAPVPSDPDGLRARAELLLRQEKFVEAEPLWRRLVRGAKDRAELHTGLACALEGQGRLAESEKAYRAALALDPADAFTLLRLGHLCDKLGLAPEAIALTRRSLAALPGYGCARLQLARLLMRNGGGKEAAQLIADETAADPAAGHTAAHLGHTFWWRGDLERAEIYLRRGLEPVEVAPCTWISLASLLEERGRVSEATALIREVLAHDPSRADAHALMAQLAAQAHRPAEAAAEVLAALRADPGPSQLEAVARALIRVNSTPERAEALLKTALTADPTDHDAHEDLADAYLGQGRDREALAEIQIAQGLRPGCRRCQALEQIRIGDTALLHWTPSGPTPNDAAEEAALAIDEPDHASARSHLDTALAREPGNRTFQRLAARLAAAR